MVRDKYHAATYMVGEGYVGRISVTALCALARSAAIFVSLYGSELLDEDLEMLRFNLRRFDARWTLGREYG
jgi:diphthamide biosynthesis methyltransferase